MKGNVTLPREKQYESPAARQRAYLERKRTEQESVNTEQEQQVKDYFGYAPSESRSQVERQAVADRILGRSSKPNPPRDVNGVASWNSLPLAPNALSRPLGSPSAVDRIKLGLK